MFSKRSLLTLLVGLNLVLLVLLFMGSYSGPAAFAQSARGGGGGFVSVTAKAQGQAYDALYLLDASAQTLHAFYPTNVQQKRYVPVQPRDLSADFALD